ncbi:nascent polypeptide-associated complex protein [Candidatus Micrarchaeota archaeon]|nr:nascent polypeptide-associated complex protein [Candidatus Micrarchaeota archaeon]
MLPNMNPKQMEKMMKQMGINSKEINAEKVVIYTEGEEIHIDNPNVTQITMQGQTSFQVGGIVSKREKINEQDVLMVMEKAGVNREKAVEALKEHNGDIAETILSFQE